MSTLLPVPLHSIPLVACLLTGLPGLALAHGYGYGYGPGPQHAPRPYPQSPLVGLPPTYIAPGSLPPWAVQPQPAMPPPVGAPPQPWEVPQFTIPADPGLSQRRLLDEELRLRGYDNGRWQNNWQGPQWNNGPARGDDRHNDPRQPGYGSGYGPNRR